MENINQLIESIKNLPIDEKINQINQIKKALHICSIEMNNNKELWGKGDKRMISLSYAYSSLKDLIKLLEKDNDRSSKP